MKKVITTFAFFLFIGLFSGQAQEIQRPFKDVVPPSPTVANLMRFEEVPVNLYTGAPSISIPLFQKNLGGGMSMGLQLSYNTSGIRVDERSGWTGTGWSLMAGGSISRTIKDLPDESNTGTQLGTFNNGYHNWDNMSQADQEEFLWHTSAGTQKYDSQVDIFQYNFMGKSGRFSIVRNGSSLEAKLISRSERIKIDFTANTDGEISAFTLTDAQGYQYVFGTYIKAGTTYEAIESTESQGQYSRTTQFGQQTPSAVNIDNAPVNSSSAWHLLAVLLPNSLELASLHYRQSAEGYKTPSNEKRNRLLTPLTDYNFNTGYSTGVYNRGVLSPAILRSWSLITVNTEKLEKIEFKDGTDIFLEASGGHPELNVNENGENLARISLRDENDNTLQYYDFAYTTSTSGRLFLTGLSHKSGSEIQEYLLSYEDMDDLPPFNSEKKDQWGYYNQNNNDNSISEANLYRQAHHTGVTTGVLKSITYPTGGTKNFLFESNTFSFVGKEFVDLALIPQNTTSHSKGSVLTATAAQASGNNSLIFYVNHDHIAKITQSNHVYGSEVEVDKQKLKFEPVIDNTGTYSTDPNAIQVPIAAHFSPDNSNNRSEFNVNLTNTGMATSQTIGLKTGWYKVNIIATSSYLTTSNSTNISVNASIGYRNYEVLQNFMYGAGIRIKEVQFKDDNIVKSSIKYSYDIPDSAGYSSGSFDGLLLKKRTYTITRNHLMVDGISYVSGAFEYEVDDDKNILYTTADKNHFIGYRNVIKEQTGNGHVDYLISSPREYPSFEPDYGFPFDPVDDQSYKTGHTLEEVVFDSAGNDLSKKVNTYLNTPENVVKSLFVYEDHLGGCAWNSLYDTHYAYTQKGADNNPASLYIANADNCGSPFDFVRRVEYWEKATRSDLIATEQTEYFPAQAGLSKSSRQTFSYNNTNWQISQKRDFIFEGGDEYLYTTNFYYPDSYPTTYYSTAEQTNLGHMLGNDNKYNELIAINTTRQQVGVLLSQDTLNIVVNKYTSSGTSNYRLKSYHVSETPATTASLEERYEVVSYDVFGNPLEVKQTGGPPIAYAWGYGSTLPVIQAQNTTATELNTAIIAAIGNTALPTGVSSLQDLLDHVGDLSTPDQRGDWATFSQKLNEHLGHAQASTMTYHRVYGMTSQTAPNGQVQYFEYDAFGRLKYIKDRNQNILKANEYGYQVNANATQN